MKLANLFAVLIILLLYSCAQQVSPSGGPRDVLAPKVTAYKPDSAKTNFTSKKIEIEFNEYITLKDVGSQFTMSPPLKETPEIKAKKKSIVVEIKDTLKEATTYTLNFGNSIVDITEGNAIKNFSYIFTTGSSIDTLSTQGNIVNAFTDAPEKNVLVMLYSQPGDSAIFKTLPDYYSKTDDNGSFSIDHIKEGKYTIYALKDKNANNLADPEEPLSFLDSSIHANSKGTKLLLFESSPSKLRLKKSESYNYGAVRFIFNKAVTKFELTDINNKPLNYYTEYSKVKDTVTVWSENFTTDSLISIINADDVKDTVELRLIKKNTKETGGRGRGASPVASITSNASLSNKLKASDLFSLQFSNPVMQVDTSLISLTQRKKNLNYTIVKDSINKRKIYFKFKTIPDSSYSLVLLKGAVTDIMGTKSDSTVLDFKAADPSTFGTVKLTISTSIKEPLILQLLTSTSSLLREQVLPVNSSKVVQYNELPAGTYNFRIIVDSNGNGRWDTGDFIKKIQPEKIINYSGTVTVRENWDQELEWPVKL